MRLGGTILAAGLFALGCGEPATATDGGLDGRDGGRDGGALSADDAGARSRIRIAANDPGGFSQPSPESLTIGELQFLLVRFEAPALPEPVAWAHLTLRGPTGTRYAEQLVPFSADPTITQAPAPETNEPLEVRRPVAVAAGLALDFAIPVAGTELQLRPQTGVFTVSVKIEGAPDLAAEAHITLEAK